MARITALDMLTTAGGAAYLSEVYGKVIENIQKGLVSASMKNMDLSGDPTSGTLVAKRFKNAVSQAYGTARTGGQGNAVKSDEVTVAIDVDKEFVEELEQKDVRLYGVEGVVARRAANHTLRMEAELDEAFFSAGALAANALNQSGYANIEEELEAIIQECETVKNNFVDGVPRSMMNLILSPKYYGKIRNYLDKTVNNANIDTAAEEFYTYHGVKAKSSVHLPAGCDYMVIVDGAIAQPVMPDKYKAEKIPLSNAYALELFFSYGTKVVTPDLIFKKGTFTAVGSSATFDSTKTYYTLSNGVYTVADIDAFAQNTTYYTMA